MQAFLSWLGFEQTVDGDIDDSSDEAFNLQRALSLSSWPTTRALGPQGTFNSSTACMDWVHAWTWCMHGHVWQAWHAWTISHCHMNLHTRNRLLCSSSKHADSPHNQPPLFMLNNWSVHGQNALPENNSGACLLCLQNLTNLVASPLPDNKTYSFCSHHVFAYICDIALCKPTWLLLNRVM